MAYIPEDAEWYLADLVVEIRVEDDPRCVVHVNSVLVNAKSPGEAYEKALDLGVKQVGEPYLNPAGKRVDSRFIGIQDLAVIHDKLEHGAELFFVERSDLQSEEVRAMIPARDELSVFAEIEPAAGPDYSSGQIEQDFKSKKAG